MTYRLVETEKEGELLLFAASYFKTESPCLKHQAFTIFSLKNEKPKYIEFYKVYLKKDKF